MSGLILPRGYKHRQSGFILPGMFGSKKGGGGGAATTLDPAFNGTNNVLSNGNLTVSRPSGFGWSSTAGTTSRSSGKYYVEASEGFFAQFVALGFTSNRSSGIVGFPGDESTGIGYFNDGSYWSGGSFATATGNATNIPKRLEVALDLDNRKFWCRNNTGNTWNSAIGGTQDPATNQGGIALPAGMASGDVWVLVGLLNPSDIMNVNFGASAFGSTPPSGFVAWG